MKQNLDKIILEIYEAATEPTQWATTMSSIATILNADGVHFFANDKYNKGEVLGAISHKYHELNTVHFKDQYQKDPRADLIVKQPIGKVIRAEALVSPQQQKKLPGLQKHMKRFQCANVVGSNLGVSNYDAWLGIGRWPPDTPFESDEIKRLECLLPHLRKALRLHIHMKEMQLSTQGLTTLWNATNKAIVFIDGHKKIVFSNKCAEALFEKNWLKSVNQTLVFANQTTNKKFQSALSSMFQTQDLDQCPQDTFLATDETDAEYGVRVSRYIGHDKQLNFGSSNLAIVMITPLSMSESPRLIDLRSFSKLYNLTEAEEQVFIALANDMDLKEFSNSKNIKIDTARKQLKSVLTKTGLNNQKQLVRLIDRFCFLQLQ